MSNNLTKFQDLQEWTGCKSLSGVLSFLIENNIPYMTGNKGKPCTTVSAIELALGIRQNQTLAEMQPKKSGLKILGLHTSQNENT